MRRLCGVALSLLALSACGMEPEGCPVHPVAVERDSVAQAVPDSLLPQIWAGTCGVTLTSP